MSSHFPMPPDPMPLREALRGLRFLLRRGGETLADTVTIETLPRPAATIAGAVLHKVGGLARNMDQIASGLAKSVLGAPAARSVTLDSLTSAPDQGAAFGAAVYVALGAVLRRLGAPGVFVSEAAARRAYGLGQGGDAARLTFDLLDARVLRGTTADEAARVPGAALEPVAVFAVLLWLQSSRSDAEDEASLDAATDLAVALCGAVNAACAARDAGQLAALYARYAAHV